MSRPGVKPGRGARTRTGSRRLDPRGSTAAEPATKASAPATPDEPVARRRSSLTSRAVAFAVVLLVLTISYATSLRIYFAQSAEIAATRAEINQRQARITDLQSDLTRWQDPDYVKTQARIRLGWVTPGEVGYRVVGDNGQPIGGGEITSAQPVSSPQPAWWQKLWGSVEAADQPRPTQAKPTKQPTITEDTKPAPSASPR